MNWTIFLNFLTALAIMPPILKWCFLKGYRIDLRRKDFEKISTHLSNYIRNTYKEKSSKEPSELQAETNILLADDKTNYLIIFYALDQKINDLFNFLNNIKYANFFLDIDYKENSINFKSRLTRKTINRFFAISFSLHISTTIFWIFSYIIKSDHILWIPKNLLTLGLIIITSTLVFISSKAKTVEILSKKIPITFPD